MSDLIEFLCARLDEDEQIARAALCDDPRYLTDDEATADNGVWQTSTHPHDECVVRGAGIVIYDEGGHTAEQARHIARNDPARVLAEVDAKRRILDAAEGSFDAYDEDPYDETRTADSSTFEWILRVLALPYADHPDYREEWRP